MITIDHVDAVGSNASPAIYVNSRVAATISVVSSLAIETGLYPGIDITTEPAPGPMRFEIVGNRVSAHGDAASSTGIYVEVSDAASVLADIDNNVIWDVARSTTGSYPAGLTLFVSGSLSSVLGELRTLMQHLVVRRDRALPTPGRVSEPSNASAAVMGT